MNLETLTKIIELIATLLGIVITSYILPYLRSRYGANELEKLKEYISLGVRCAEMYFDTKDGKEKKEYVRKYAKDVLENLVQITITDEQLDVMIEGVVCNVKGYCGK